METPTVQRAAPAASASTTWRIDPSHSTIGFSVKHMKVATVHGRFGGCTGTIRFAGDRPLGVDVQIAAATIDTGITKRDDHLRSTDFFDVTAYPTITFRSTQIELATPLRRDRWRVTGELTMHGITRSVELVAEQTGGGPEPRDGAVISFAVTTQLSRKDFGIGQDLPLDKAEFVISDEVKITIEVQATNITS